VKNENLTSGKNQPPEKSSGCKIREECTLALPKDIRKMWRAVPGKNATLAPLLKERGGVSKSGTNLVKRVDKQGQFIPQGDTKFV